ncbi:MAG: PAS domain S-box protein [Syntrophales bacterium]
MEDKENPKNRLELEPLQLLHLLSEVKSQDKHGVLLEIALSIVESAGDSIYLVDRDCRYLFMNRTYLSRLGVSLEGVIGKSYGEFHTKKQEEEFKRKIEEVFATGGQVQHEHISRRDQRYFLRTFSPMKNPSDGKIIGVTVLSKDITRLKLAEERLRESEEKYRGIIENMDEGYHEVDLAGNFTFFNEAFRKMMGYSREELLGMNYRKYAADEENARKVFRAYNEVYRTGKHLEWFEWEIVRKDGARRTLQVTATLLRSLEGRPAGFRGIVIDVTERIRAEETLRMAEELYRTLATHSRVAIYIVQDGKIRFTNPYLPHYSGYAEEDLIGMDILDFVYPEDREMVRIKAVKMLKGESTTPYEFRIIDKNGQIRWIVETVSSITFQGRRATLGNSMDITEHKMLEQQLNDTREMLLQSEKLAAVGKLSAGVAHEILNPINIISMRLQLMEITENLPEKVRETLKICEAQIKRVVKIAKDLSQFSRITPKHIAPEDLNKLIEQVLALTAPKLKMDGVTVERIYKEGLPFVSMDRFRIEQVILNIIINAMDAMAGREEKKLRICTSVEEADGRKFARVSFSDTGTGIKSEDMMKIFDPFFTTKEIGKGTGLGLSICYGIVKEHEGRIWAQNNNTGGATFFIELPLTQDSERQV